MYYRQSKTNNMRTVEEKEFIVKRYLNGESAVLLTNEYELPAKLIYKWIKKYETYGIDGLKSQTGKTTNKNKGLWNKKAKSYQEELELKIMKLEIENARLKKGYIVKGGGAQKEYVTTLDKNMK